MATPTSDHEPLFPGPEHDHAQCVQTALDAAATACHERGERLTPLRRRVLELVWRGHQPVGAYTLVHALSQERGHVAPPTVYRALDFLLQQGFVHRIEHLNAYIGCRCPETPHAAHFLVCRVCGTAAELPESEPMRALEREAEAAGFAVEGETVEIRGRCPACREEAASA